MEVTKYSTNENGGSVMAYVNIHIEKWGLHLTNCRLVRTSKGATFLAAPAKKYEDDAGNAKYEPFWLFDRAVSDRFQSAVKESIDRYLKQGQDFDGNRENEENPF